MISTITLNNGTSIPQLGFGTLKIPPDRAQTPENARKTADVVSLALQIGYRHIDTAQMYGNEMGVGLARTATGQSDRGPTIFWEGGGANRIGQEWSHDRSVKP